MQKALNKDLKPENDADQSSWRGGALGNVKGAFEKQGDYKQRSNTVGCGRSKDTGVLAR